MQTVNIRQAAAAAGVSVKTARYYCDIGLVRHRRGQNNYRVFSPEESAELSFAARARAVGFSLDECRRLLILWRDRRRSSADVKAMALDYIDKIEKEIRLLKAARARLLQMASECPGDNNPDCPILDTLAGKEKDNDAPPARLTPRDKKQHRGKKH